MVTTDTGRQLGALLAEKAVRDESEGAGSPPRTDYRPHRTPLLNDGCWHYWMTPGEDYNIEHDGQGWRATCRTWPDGTHRYRLARAGTLDLVNELVLDDGGDPPLKVVLDPGRRYRLQSVGNGAWMVHELP